MFLVLAGSTAEVQTRLHQSFAGQSARTGAEDTGEKETGECDRPTVRCCCQAEERPQCPVYLSERYCARSHPYLSHPLYYFLHMTFIFFLKGVPNPLKSSSETQNTKFALALDRVVHYNYSIKCNCI